MLEVSHWLRAQNWGTDPFPKPGFAAILLRFELEDDHSKIGYLESFLEGLTLDTFVGISEHIWLGNNFHELVLACKWY